MLVQPPTPIALCMSSHSDSAECGCRLILGVPNSNTMCWVQIMVRPTSRLCALFRPHICWLRWSVLSSSLPDRHSDYRYRCMTCLNLYEMRCVDVDPMPQISALSALFLTFCSFECRSIFSHVCFIRVFEQYVIPTNRSMGLVG